MIVQTGNDSDGTNDTYLRTGDASGGDSGNVYISTGTAGGTKGSVYVQSELDMSSNKIINVETPTTYSGAANKGYVDSQAAAASGTTDHALLNNLDYASSGHTGFVSNIQLTTTSGDIIDQIPTDYYTTVEVDTISGSLSTEIDNNISTHASSSDHDGRYYTETELNNGQLDSRYYTESEVDTISGSIVSQIPTDASEILYDGTETVEHILDDTLNGGILHQVTITVVSGLDITWTAAKIYDHGTQSIVTTVSGAGTCSDNAINYLKWSGGTSLTLSTTKASVDEVEISNLHAQGGLLWTINYDSILSNRERSISRALSEMFEVVVTEGLIVSEDEDATNPLDIVLSAGSYYSEGHEKVTLTSGIYSRLTSIYRWYHDAEGNWTYDTNAEIDTANYDTGTGLTPITSNRYVKSYFMYDGNGHIYWIYPNAEYTNISDAIEAPLPDVPTASTTHPKCTALIYQEGDTSLPSSSSDQWIDIRPQIGITTGAGNAIVDHGHLLGLTDDDHTQYHNNSRGDARYYTKSEVDGKFSNGISGWFDDGTNFRVTVVSGLITNIGNSVSGGYSLS